MKELITAEAVMEKLRESGIRTMIQNVMKNGIKKTGITLKIENGAAPILYLEDFTENASSAGEVAERMLPYFRDLTPPDINVEALRDPSWLLSHMYIGLQRVNEEELIKAESGYAGIEKYIYLRLDEKMQMSTKLRSDFLRGTGITEEAAWDAAERNTFSEGETVVRELGEFMIGLGYEGPVDWNSGPYIVTNRPSCRGSVGILDREAIRRFFSEKGLSFRNFIVLPSSIDECLLVPTEGMPEPSELDIFTEMVQSINASEVAPEEQLGDQAYVLEL